LGQFPVWVSKKVAARQVFLHTPHTGLLGRSALGVLLSRRTPLRGEMFTKELALGIYGILMATRTAGRDGRSLLGA
jgi:hypothetical protein